MGSPCFDDDHPSYTNFMPPGSGEQQSSSPLNLLSAEHYMSPMSQSHSPHLSHNDTFAQGSHRWLHSQNPSLAGSTTSLQALLPPTSHSNCLSPPADPDYIKREYGCITPASGHRDLAYQGSSYTSSPVSPRSWPTPDRPFLLQQQPDAPMNFKSLSPLSPAEQASSLGTQNLVPYAQDLYQEGFQDNANNGLIPGDELLHSFPPNQTDFADDLAMEDSFYVTSPTDCFDNLEEVNHLAQQPAPIGSPNITTLVKQQTEPYAQLICKALKSKPDYTMTLQEIYEWFRENTDKDQGGGKGWQNSIRHNLSMNAAFTKRERGKASNAILGGQTPFSTSSGSKRSTEWVLEDWAIKNGVQSTTRYRKGNNASKRQGGTSGPSSPNHSDFRRGHHHGSRRPRTHRYSHGYTMPRPISSGPVQLGKSSMAHGIYPHLHPEAFSIPRIQTPSFVSVGGLHESPLALGAPISEPFGSHTMAGLNMPHNAPFDSSGMGDSNYTFGSREHGIFYNNPHQMREFPCGLGDVTGIYGGVPQSAVGNAEDQPLFEAMPSGLGGFPE